MKKEVNISDFADALLAMQKRYDFIVCDELSKYRDNLNLPNHLYLLTNSRRSKFLYASVHKSPSVDIEQILDKLETLLHQDSSMPDVVEVYYPQVVPAHTISGLLSTAIEKRIELSIKDYNELIKEETFEVLLEPKEKTIFSQIGTLEKNLYDIMLDAGNVTDIKNDVLRAYILNYLYYHTSIPEEDLVTLVKEVTSCDEMVIKKLITSLLKKGKINISGTLLELAPSTINIIKEAICMLEKEEREMKSELETIFKKYGLEDKNVEKIVTLLVELYKRPVDIKQSESVHTSSINLFKTEAERIIGADKIEAFCNDVKELCASNNFFNRVGSNSTFVSYYQNEEFQNYANNRKKNLYIDTSLLAYIFCKQTGYVSLRNKDWNDSLYKATIRLWLSKLQNKNLSFCTMDGYIDELCGELRKALSCAMFDEYENAIFKIGTNTRNVFYNYFQFLRESDYVDKSMSFAAYVTSLGFPNDVMADNFKDKAKKRFKDIFSEIGVQIRVCRNNYEEFWDTATSLYDNILLDSKSTKTRNAMEMDIRQTLYLMLNNEYQQNEVNYFVSWDKTMSNLRDRLDGKYPNRFSFFAIYPPHTLLHVLSMERMNVNKNWLTDSVFAFADIQERVGQKWRNLVDSILLPLFDTEPSSIKFFNELFSIQKKIFGEDVMDDEDRLVDDKAPIEQILDDMRKCAQNFSSGRENFREYLQDEKNNDFIKKIYESGLQKLRENKYTSEVIKPLASHYKEYWHQKNEQIVDEVKLS